MEEKVISKVINYEKKLNPIYIESMEANHIYVNDCARKTDEKVEYKIGGNWVEFNGIGTRKAVLADSLFLRFMQKSIVRDTSDLCRDFIVVKFNYDVDYRINGIEEKVRKHDLREQYYKNGVTHIYEKKNKNGEVVEEHPIHYKMLMRSTGKAKDGECVFIRDNLHHKAINFLTMGLYDLMSEQAKQDPEKVFRLVELSAYQTLTTATAKGYIHIPLENILIVKDEEVYSDAMRAEIVTVEDKVYFEDKFVIDFESPKLEEIINKKGFTFDDKKENFVLIKEKSKDALKSHGIRVNGKFPGWHEKVEHWRKECVVNHVSDVNIKNVLWDGMGLIDESIFPKGKDGFIYCRSHFFKSCLFRGNVQDFFKDYCNEHEIDYDTYTLEKVDMFERKIKISDVKVIITDKSLKWLKFIDMMGGTEKEKAYKYYRRFMKQHGDYFSIVKSACHSKWEELQLMAYQMNNSLPTTDREVLGRVAACAINLINELKTSDEAYLKYLHMKEDDFNINRLLLELIEWNPEFMKTEFFRKKKSTDISKLKEEFCEGRLPQIGDNLTIMDNPISLLLKAVGDKNYLEEGCFDVVEDGVQCYTPRFKNCERLAAFRSPHNSPNNIIHLYNVYPDKVLKYFPNTGRNVIIFNAIKTDTQARLSGHDVDSDFVYTTNQKDLADLARKAYIEYPTIINQVEEKGTSNYHFSLEDYAKMDNQIADAQASIGMSTDIAQLALSYYYDEGMESSELEECFIILSVLGQIAIDLAKKSFDINVVKEIGRIKSLPCMKRNEVPFFFAKTKKSRNNKEYDEHKVRSMNCPMDIMADIIENSVIGYAPRQSHVPLRNFWNGVGVKGKVNRYKKKKVISEAELYNKQDKWLEAHKDKLDDNTFFRLKSRSMIKFLNRVAKNLEPETIMQLVIYATDDKNTDVRNTILNFLFSNYKEEFMNCFVKSIQKVA